MSTWTSFSGVISGPGKGPEQWPLANGTVGRVYVSTRSWGERDEKAEIGTLGKKEISMGTGMFWATKSWRGWRCTQNSSHGLDAW